MSLKKIPFAEADRPQLMAFAETVLGIEVVKSWNEATVRSKIETVQPGIEFILASEQAPQVTQAQPAPLRNEAMHREVSDGFVDPEGISFRSDPKVLIRIPTEEYRIGGKDSVKVGVNGDMFVINRDVDVAIPYRVYLVLTQAWESHFEQTFPNGPTEKGVLVERRVLSYPFNILAGLPSDEVIAEWNARTSRVKVPDNIGKTPAELREDA